MGNEWNEERLVSLVREKVREDRFIEYKQALPGDGEDDKREFLNDVTAFANTFGGTIIFGVTEEKGVGIPKEICGCDIPKPDETVLQLSSIIQTGAEPRLTSVKFYPVDLQSSKRALVVVIPQSPAAPHMVKKGSPKFYSRGAAGKQPMDVYDIRAAFVASETITERIRNFRLDRIAKLAGGGSPIPLRDTTFFVVHLLPMASFTRKTTLDILKVQDDPTNLLKPIQFEGGWAPEYCLEGFGKVSHDSGRKAVGYTLLFRDGCIEAVDAYSLREFQGRRFLREKLYGQKLREFLPRIFTLYETQEIPFPCFLALTFVNVKGICIPADADMTGTGVKVIDRDHLVLPERELIEHPSNVDAVIRPLFDLVWNACGLARSWNYDTDGNWKPRY
jgi:hypothetical protein